MASSVPARREQGSQEVEHHDDPHEVVVVNGVSSDQEPSVEWGWHGHYPKVAQFGGFLSAAVLLILLYGNHSGVTENIWLIVMALGFAGLSVHSIVRRRRSWQK